VIVGLGTRRRCWAARDLRKSTFLMPAVHEGALPNGHSLPRPAVMCKAFASRCHVFMSGDGTSRLPIRPTTSGSNQRKKMGRSFPLAVDPRQGFSSAVISLAAKAKRPSTGGKVGPPPPIARSGSCGGRRNDGRMQAGRGWHGWHGRLPGGASQANRLLRGDYCSLC